MAGVYDRAKDLREKVDAVLLKKIEWQILFSVDGKRSTTEIAGKVQRDETFVKEVLAKLAQKMLIVGDGASDNGSSRVAEKKPAVEPVKKPQAKKEEFILDEPMETVVEKKPEKKTAVEKKTEPVAEKKPEPKKESAKVAKPAAGGGRKILVVDDSIVIQKMVEIALESEQVTLSAAMKGEDAVKAAQEFDPSLILLDMMLPDMSGLDVMKQIRALGGAMESVPIVVLSGKDSPQDKDTALSNGANDFLTKPFHDEDLLAKVHEYVH